MSDLSHVHPGDPLTVPAKTFNTMIDAARAYRMGLLTPGTTGTTGTAGYSKGDASGGGGWGMVTVRNQTGSDLDRYGIAGIDGPIIDPSYEGFFDRPAFDVVTPVDPDHLGKFVITREPIPAGELGRAWISGTCICKVNINEDHHTHADIVDGDITQLQSAEQGAAQILWTDGTWSLVDLDSRYHPPIYQAIADAVGGEDVAVNRVKLDGTLNGVSESLPVHAKVYAVRSGDTLIAVDDKDHHTTLVPIHGTHTSPEELYEGSGYTAETTTWEIDNQPSGSQGVKFKAHRLYWSGTIGEPVAMFQREQTFDSQGVLVKVGPEVRTDIIATGNCEEAS